MTEEIVKAAIAWREAHRVFHATPPVPGKIRPKLKKLRACERRLLDAVDAHKAAA